MKDFFRFYKRKSQPNKEFFLEFGKTVNSYLKQKLMIIQI